MPFASRNHLPPETTLTRDTHPDEDHVAPYVFILFAHAQELRQNEIIDRLKAFTISPDPGTVIEVSAGERKTLRIAYSADSLLYGGIHDLPVLVSTNTNSVTEIAAELAVQYSLEDGCLRKPSWEFGLGGRCNRGALYVLRWAT